MTNNNDGKGIVSARRTVTYEVISLDVIGNDKEGYEINDAHTTGREVELPESPSLDETLTGLRAVGEFDRRAHIKTVSWSPEVEHGSEELTLVRRRNGKPLLTLRPKRTGD
jgi:hypothetical protein